MKNKRNALIVISVFMVAVFALVGSNFLKINPSKTNILNNKTNISKVNISNNKKNMVIYSDYIHYSDISSITKAADVIIKGNVINVSKPQKLKIGESFNNDTKSYESEYGIYTVSDIKVIKVLKGDLKTNDIIQIKQQGGSLQDTNYIEEGSSYLQPEEVHMFFLAKFNDSPYSMLNPTQGKIKLENNKVKMSQENLVQDGLSEENLVNIINTSLKK